MTESLYAVFEVMPSGVRIAALFPSTDDGCKRAIEWGNETYDEFHAADPSTREVGEAYLKKCHGVHIDRPEADE